MFSYEKNPYDKSVIERLFDSNLINKCIANSSTYGYEFDKNWEKALENPNFDILHDMAPIKNKKSFKKQVTNILLPDIKKMVGSDDVTSSGWFIYPPTGYMGWHTNYKKPCYRLYISYAFEHHKSFFRYLNPETNEIVTDYDDKGITIRKFFVPEKPPYFWHCVGSNCIRISLGYRINSAGDKN